jgi:hypothetical protein
MPTCSGGGKSHWIEGFVEYGDSAGFLRIITII